MSLEISQVHGQADATENMVLKQFLLNFFYFFFIFFFQKIKNVDALNERFFFVVLTPFREHLEG